METESLFLFGYHSAVHSLRNYHPSPSTSDLLLGVFDENVAPIIMIIHKPALRSLIKKASTDPEELDKGSEALVFSVYFAATSSMTPEECLSRLGEDHTTLIKRYRFAVEQALARAGFLYTHKLVNLQAAVLFLSCTCYPKDAQFVWSMIAVVTRLGLGLGLHRDGTHFGLTPLEIEMRRRIWWYIYLLDVQSSDYQATSPQIREGDYDTRLPLNINDDDLSCGLVDPPQERNGFTEMTLTLVRCEILMAHRKMMQINSSGPVGHNDLFKKRIDSVEDAHRVLDERYLQYCDLAIPIHWVAATIARVALGRLWLLAHFSLMTAEGFDPSLWPDRCDLLVLTAIEVLEFVYLLETHENTAKWSWLFQGYVQWQSCAFILSELCARPKSSLSDRAWMAVNRVCQQYTGPMGHRGGLVMRPLESLMQRASAIRDRELRQPTSDFPVELDPLDTEIPDAVMENHIEPLPQDLLDVDAASLDIFKDVIANIGI